MNPTETLQELFDLAKNYAIEQDINIVLPDLLCLALLDKEEDWNKMIAAEDRQWISDKLVPHLHQQHKTLPQVDVPLWGSTTTLVGDLATDYAQQLSLDAVPPFCMMLALLATNTQSAELLKNRGWVWENYLQAATETENINGQLPEKSHPKTPNSQLPSSSSWKKALMGRSGRLRAATEIRDWAWCAFELNDHESAISLITSAREYAPDEPFFWYEHAQLLECTKNNTAAYQLLEGYQARFGLDFSASWVMAGVLDNLQRYEEALPHWQRMYDEEVTPDTSNGVGWSLLQLQRYDEAIPFFDQCLSADPEYAFAWNNKGYCLFRTGRDNEAEKLIRQSLEYDRGNSMAWRNLALIEEHRGNPTEARAFAQKAMLYYYKRDFGSDIDHLVI